MGDKRRTAYSGPAKIENIGRVAMKRSCRRFLEDSEGFRLSAAIEDGCVCCWLVEGRERVGHFPDPNDAFLTGCCQILAVWGELKGPNGARDASLRYCALRAARVRRGNRDIRAGQGSTRGIHLVPDVCFTEVLHKEQRVEFAI